ncbi:type 1 glutamine amidotransferase domain-containing protein [Microbulbifer elongatus]|uniref:type 1 glutamine amidotransferase domain-containing protein n=1 Tax=Microbulbifer elongatus TaxID=86173 RepID=UPI001E289606|nr:type 1 glutamine amidotransferase domain-containing protein [Microbulbifer elongatus]
MHRFKVFVVSFAALCFSLGALAAGSAKPGGSQSDVDSTPKNVKVLMVLTSHSALGDTGKSTGYWLGEFTHPYYKFTDAGLNVEVASIAGGKAPVDPGSLDEQDLVNQRFQKDAQAQSLVENTKKLEHVKPADYDAIVFVGGHGTVWDFPEDKAVSRVAGNIYASGGVVAAVCHGPAALVGLTLPDGSKLVQGKTVTGFTNEEEAAIELTEVVPFLLEDALKAQGATFSGGEAFKSHVVVDKRLVTGQNPQSASALGDEVVQLLK